MSPRLRLLPSLAMGLAVALAATGDAWAARELPPAAAATAPTDDGPVYTYEGLLGLSQDQTRARLGPPDLAQAEGAGAMWTYRLNSCALFVFFRSGGGQPLAMSGAAAGQRRRGQAAPTLEACLADALKAHAPPGRSRGRP